MKMIVVFNKLPGWARRAALALLAWSAGPSLGLAQTPIRFRDGADWAEARRLSRRGEALAPITFTLRNLSAHASVGRRAIVRLSAESSQNAAAFLRTHRALPVNNDAGITADASIAAVALNPRLHLYLIESTRDGEDGLALAARLSNVAGIEAVIPDLYLERRLADFEVPPNDPRYAGQWYLKDIDMARAWRVSPGDPNTTVVVVDSGCDTRHPDLVENMREGFDAIEDDTDPSFTPRIKGNEHGTACAGIIAAVGNNKLGITGTCPRCSLRCVRLFDRNHALIPVSADVGAFNFAFNTRAAVVSNSWGFAEPQPVPSLVRAAIREVLDQGRDGLGAVVVFAAGNENREIEDDEIAAIPGVLNVGAVNNFDEKAPFSNFGKSVNITAPTGTVTTDIAGPDGADATDYTSLFGGTSSACPVVAGVAALLSSIAPDKTGKEISDALLSSARPAPFATPDAQGHDPYYGQGIVDPAGALMALGVEVPEPEPPGEAPDAGEADGGDKPRKGSRDEDDDGCSCRTVGGGGSADGASVASVLLLLAVWRSRRRRSRNA